MGLPNLYDIVASNRPDSKDSVRAGSQCDKSTEVSLLQRAQSDAVGHSIPHESFNSDPLQTYQILRPLTASAFCTLSTPRLPYPTLHRLSPDATCRPTNINIRSTVLPVYHPLDPIANPSLPVCRRGKLNAEVSRLSRSGRLSMAAPCCPSASQLRHHVVPTSRPYSAPFLTSLRLRRGNTIQKETA